MVFLTSQLLESVEALVISLVKFNVHPAPMARLWFRRLIPWLIEAEGRLAATASNSSFAARFRGAKGLTATMKSCGRCYI